MTARHPVVILRAGPARRVHADGAPQGFFAHFRRLPRPNVQLESNVLRMLPTLIAETGLLSFISRHHLTSRSARTGLMEVALKEITMSA